MVKPLALIECSILKTTMTISQNIRSANNEKIIVSFNLISDVKMFEYLFFKQISKFVSKCLCARQVYTSFNHELFYINKNILVKFVFYSN